VTHDSGSLTEKNQSELNIQTTAILNSFPLFTVFQNNEFIN
jgi:hypothetical protein